MQNAGERQASESRIGMAPSKNFDRLIASGPRGRKALVAFATKKLLPVLPAKRRHVHAVHEHDRLFWQRRAPRRRNAPSTTATARSGRSALARRTNYQTIRYEYEQSQNAIAHEDYGHHRQYHRYDSRNRAYCPQTFGETIVTYE